MAGSIIDQPPDIPHQIFTLAFKKFRNRRAASFLFLDLKGGPYRNLLHQ